MSRYNDPRYLEHQQAISASGSLVLDKHRECRKCKYDLTGLRYGQNCPECGQGIIFVTSLDSLPKDTLVDVSLWYARLMATGLLACTLGWFGILFLPLFIHQSARNVAMSLAKRLYWDGGPELLLYLACAGSLLWLAGIIAITLPRPSSEKVTRGATDGIVRGVTVAVLQPMLFVAAGMILLGGINPSATLEIVGVVAVVLGMVALLPAMWALSSFAEWLGDPDCARAFRNLSPWYVGLAIAVTSGVTFRLPIGVPSKMLIVGLDILPVALVIGALYLGGRILSLTVGSYWAGVIGGNKRVRDNKLQIRFEQDQAENEEILANAPYIPDGPAFIPAPERKW